jgi:hypothetical protein
MPNTSVQAAGEAMPATIPTLYAEWIAIRHKPTSEKSEAELNEEPSRYQVLQKAIIAAEPRTPQDVAMMFIVDTDDGDSYHSDVFEARVRELVKVEDAADPLFAAITDYRNATAALSDLEVPDDVTLDEENAMFDAVYGRQKDVLIDAAPIATSMAGVREAIRLTLDEDSVCDMLAEGALRAALAYLDGRASA